jgi:cytochrome b6-f complex iron-sulfur subunit
MKSQRLAMATGCGGCSRRSVLRGLGVAAVGALMLDAGCQQQGSLLSTASSSSCGTGHCIDLGDAANKELMTVGGAMLIDSSNDTIMVVRMSDTQAIALSAICTHAGCSMDYEAAQQLLNCACHGSQFSTAGNVVRGPANRPLRLYTATLANNVITVAG